MSREDDRGVVSVFVVILMSVVLMAAGAIAVDGTNIVNTKKRAQNSADAAALAIATACAWTSNPVSPAPYLKADQTAAQPGCGGGTVTVTVTKTNGLKYAFVRGNAPISRTAKATWKTIDGITGPFPAIFGAACLPAIPSTGQILVASGSGSSAGGPCGLSGSHKGYLQNGCTNWFRVGGPAADNGNNLNGTGCNEGPASQPKTLEYFRTHDAFGLGTGIVLLPLRAPSAPTADEYVLAGFLLFKLDGWTTQGGGPHAGGVAFTCPDNQGMCVHGDILGRQGLPPSMAPPPGPSSPPQCFNICDVYLVP